MGRHTELIEHKIPETSSIILDNKVKEVVNGILLQNLRLMEIHIVQGQDVIIRYWDDVWTSGL